MPRIRPRTPACAACAGVRPPATRGHSTYRKLGSVLGLVRPRQCHRAAATEIPVDIWYSASAASRTYQIVPGARENGCAEAFAASRWARRCIRRWRAPRSLRHPPTAPWCTPGGPRSMYRPDGNRLSPINPEESRPFRALLAGGVRHGAPAVLQPIARPNRAARQHLAARQRHRGDRRRYAGIPVARIENAWRPLGAVDGGADR
jgi:hypothetical protein